MPYRGKQNYQQDYQQDYPQQDFQQDYQQDYPQQDFQQDYQQQNQPQQGYQQADQYQQDYQQADRYPQNNQRQNRYQQDYPQQNRYPQNNQRQNRYQQDYPQQGQGGQPRRFKGNNGGRPNNRGNRASSQSRSPEFYDQHPNYARPVLKEDGSPEWRKIDAEVISVYRSNPFQNANPNSILNEACYIRVQPLTWKHPVNINGFIDSAPQVGDKLHIYGTLAEKFWNDNEGKPHRSFILNDARCKHLEPLEWQHAMLDAEAYKMARDNQPPNQSPQNAQQSQVNYQQSNQYQQANFQAQAPVQSQVNAQPQANFQSQAPVPPQANVQPQANFQSQAPVQSQGNAQPQAPIPPFDESIPVAEEENGPCPF